MTDLKNLSNVEIWIFNFGHGFLPESPFENAKFITNWVKEQDWR